MRKSIDNFDGGINNIDDAQLLNDNVLTQAQNYEYTDYNGIKKRKGIDLSELSGLYQNVRSFTIWYPNNKPSDMLNDKIYFLQVKQ